MKARNYAYCNLVRHICSTLVIQTGEKSQERQEWRKGTKREPLHAIHLTQDLPLVGKRKLFSMREKNKKVTH